MENESTTNESEQPVVQSVSRYEELKNMVAAMEQDFERFFVNGNKAAGTRVRGAMQELKNFAQAVRTEVQNIKNSSKSAS